MMDSLTADVSESILLLKQIDNREDCKMNKSVYLYVFDSMADWEIGFLTAELNSGRYYKKGLSPLRIVTVGWIRLPLQRWGA